MNLKKQRMGVATHQPWSRTFAAFCIQPVYTHRVDTHTPVHMFQLSILAVFLKTSSFKLTWQQAAHKLGAREIQLYENLAYVHMQPMAVALNYSVENIRNVQHTRNIYIYLRNPAFNSLVWTHSCMFAPTMWCLRCSCSHTHIGSTVVPCAWRLK